MKLMKFFVTLLVLLLLSACSSPFNESTSSTENLTITKPQPDKVVDEPKDAEPKLETNELTSFFMANGTIANYLGEGNEFASYRSRTQWHNANTVSVYEENGGTTMLRTFRVTEEAIFMIKEQGEYYEEFNPTNDELNTLTPLSSYLQLPLEEGASFDDWQVRNVNLTIGTPFKTFNNVLLLEKTDEVGNINRRYIVKNYGEVKREFIMQDGDRDYVVTSTLESVE